MLDNQIINIRSEVDNWLQSFNEAISQQKNKDESINILSNLFFEDSHWRDILGEKILLLKNETLIDDQKGVTSKLLDHCNLEWEDTCLEFYKTERDVRTISLRQVRNPINKNSLGIWKKYSGSFDKMSKLLETFL